MCIIEFDGYNGWEKYLVTYSQAITLIPILAPKLPSITITDYEYSKVQRENNQNENRAASSYSESNEGFISGSSD
jgi:hypothetical protein